MNNESAYCGLYCKACAIYIATENNDEGELQRLAGINQY